MGDTKNPDVRSLDPTRCGFLFDHFTKLHQEHSDLLTKTLEGRPVCAALPMPAGADFTLLNHINAVRQNNGLAIGAPTRGPLTKRWVVPLDFPLRNDQGAIIGTVSAPIDLMHFNPFVGSNAFTGLPEGTVASILTPDLTMLARSQYPEKWIGERLPSDPDLVELIRNRSGTAFFASPLDHRMRIHGAAPVAGTDWVTLSSIPTAPLETKMNVLLREWAGIFGFAFLTSLMLAYLLARQTSQPILSVAETTDRVKNGDPCARANPDGCKEVISFASAFNSMMDSLQEQHAELAASAERYHSVFTGSKVAMLLIEPADGSVIDANLAAAAYYGWDIDALKKMKIMDINTLSTEAVAAEMKRAEKERRDHFFFRHRLRNGEIRDVEVHSGPVEMNGRALLLSTIHDITERKRDEERLKLAANVFVRAREGIMITDEHNNIIDVNEAFTQITGYTREEAIGEKPDFLKSGRQSPDYYKSMWKALQEKGNWYSEIWNRRKNGELYAEMINISAIRDENGRIKNFVAIFSDVTSIKEHQEQLERIAHYDALTSLPNRVLLADRLQQAIAQSQRRNVSLAVVYLDLDGFKAVNDRYGHQTGDELLIAAAQRMKDALRPGDTLARIGGDEFVAILIDLTRPQDCEPVLVRLLKAASDPITVGEQTLHVSASIGVTLCPQDSIDADQLMRHADQAMYNAKQGGKNRYCLFDTTQEKAARAHGEAIENLRKAVQNNEFVLYYQPKVNMSSGTVISAEALIRWQHPERGLLLPAQFLPAIENNALSEELGDWVLDTALNQMTLWRARGFVLPVSVNIGARQLQRKDFTERLQKILAAHPPLPSGSLELELLESSALKDIDKISELMRACQSIGVRFALDDFGTGYSVLTYLRHLPADSLKIDQTFVRGMLENPDDLAIVEGVLGLVSAFHCEAVAEGVETTAHGELLLGLGCHLGQGFGIAKPMPAADLPDWVATWKPSAAWTSWQNRSISRDEKRWLIANVEHWYWFQALENFLTKEGKSPPPMDVHKCHFGRWVEMEGRDRYKEYPELPAIDELHERIHALGQRIVDLKEEGKVTEALACLGQLGLLRDEFKSRLQAFGISRPDTVASTAQM